MKKIFIIVMIGLVALEMNAQTMVTNDSTKLGIKSAVQVLTEWNTERMLDSLDQEKLPKKVTCGILAGANLNNFIITRDHQTMHSHMRIGAEYTTAGTAHGAAEPFLCLGHAEHLRFGHHEPPLVVRYRYTDLFPWSFRKHETGLHTVRRWYLHPLHVRFQYR